MNRAALRESHGVTIVDLKGRLAQMEGANSVREIINGLLHRGVIHMLVNLEDVPSIDASSVGELIAGRKRVARAGGSVKLLHASPRQVSSFEASKLYRAFEVFTDESRAATSFCVGVA